MRPTTSHGIACGRVDGSWSVSDLDVEDVLRRGLRWVRTTCDAEGRWESIRWTSDQYAVGPEDDDKITRLSDGGVSVMLNLGPWTPSSVRDRPRFTTAAEFERYMNYAQFCARHFRGRVACYEIWNEPDGDTPGWHIDLTEYLDLVRVTNPVIQEEDPNAKIAVGAARSPEAPGPREYLLGVCASDAMQLAQVVTWNALRDIGPSIADRIAQTAAEHGFTGACMSVPPTPLAATT